MLTFIHPDLASNSQLATTQALGKLANSLLTYECVKNSSSLLITDFKEY